MDIQLQELIEKIKKDGIETASSEAAALKANAEAEAKRIVEAARREADELIAKGKQDAERSEKAGLAAVEQASRNVILSFKDEIQTLLDKIVSKEISAAFNSDSIKTVLPEIVKSLSQGKAVDVVLNEKDKNALDSWAKGALSTEISGGLELKVGRLAAGFRISAKDGSAYYDFSAESVSEALCAYVNPNLANALRSASKGL
ncbi:MAG: V-type ATP synthase subunit E [Termitinemataceae bacterium]|nr:MAG: V-type ATP synthase subunit E [Termitinemataceae bacterium]